MSLDARAVALQGLVPVGAGGAVVLVTGEPSADVLLALSAHLDAALTSDLAAPQLSADNGIALGAHLQSTQITAETC